MNLDYVKSLISRGLTMAPVGVLLILLAGLAQGIIPGRSHVRAQSPQPSQAASSPAGLTTLSFGFGPDVATRLELRQIDQHNRNTIPTEPYAYRAEVRTEPSRNQTYFGYEARQTLAPHAVLRVKNETGKTVASVEWEFNYPRFKRGKEVVAYQVRSRLKIPPGQVGSLADELPQDGCNGLIDKLTPNGRVIARFCGTPQKRTGTYPLDLKIKKIKYTDGTVWQATP